MPTQALCWYVHAKVDGKRLGLVAAAVTELSARRQARKALGKNAAIVDVTPVGFAHAWVIDSRLVEAVTGDV